MTFKTKTPLARREIIIFSMIIIIIIILEKIYFEDIKMSYGKD